MHMSEQPQESEAEILRALDQTEKSRMWISRNYGELRKKYEGKAFAVVDEKVISAKDSIVDLVNEVKGKGIDSPNLLVESIPPKGVVFIL